MIVLTSSYDSGKQKEGPQPFCFKAKGHAEIVVAAAQCTFNFRLGEGRLAGAALIPPDIL